MMTPEQKSIWRKQAFEIAEDGMEFLEWERRIVLALLETGTLQWRSLEGDVWRAALTLVHDGTIHVTPGAYVLEIKRDLAEAA